MKIIKNSVPLKIILISLTIIYCNTLWAQSGKNKREQIQAQKVAFITTKLALTPEEAEKFWPVYNEHAKLKREFIQSFGNAERIENIDLALITDEEATQIADNQIIMAQKLLDLRKEYYIRYKSVLPIKKVLKLYQSEKEFQRVLLERIKKQGQRGGY